MEETAAFKKRPLKELFEMILKEFKKGNKIGICSVVFVMRNSDKISNDETERVLEFLKINRPEPLPNISAYWFYNADQRIEFLNKMIEKTCEHKNENFDGKCIDCMLMHQIPSEGIEICPKSFSYGEIVKSEKVKGDGKAI